MKKLFTLFLLTFMPLVVYATYLVEYGGINYFLFTDTKTATVVNFAKNYSGDIVIPETITDYGDVYKVTSIGRSTFLNCSGLTSITIPNSVTSIGYCAFSGCSGLTSITIPNSVSSIGVGAFMNCSNLTSITIPNSVTSIGSGAFSSCSNLTSITIPNSVTSIGPGVFSGCSGLTSITIPNSVTSIGSGAFSSCSNLTSITIPNSVTSIGEGAFDGTAWYNNQPNGVVYVGKALYKYKGSMPAGTKISIEEGTVSITEFAFKKCSGLTSVTIPNGVTSIGGHAFECCSSLTSVTIPNSVSSIGSGAFSETPWDNNLPDGIIYLGKMFYRYKGTMPAGTIINIEEGTLGIAAEAFNSPNLTAVTIPNSVTNIDENAFWSTGLTSVTIPNSVTRLGGSAFFNCTNLKSVDIPNSITSIDGFTFAYCSKLTSITIPNSVETIGHSAFIDCSSLTSVTIPNSVTFIDQFAFYNCSNLTTITIGKGIKEILQFAFGNCSQLTDVYCYADEVEFPHDDAFKNSNTSNATLHIPVSSIDVYMLVTFWPWYQFKEVVALEYEEEDEEEEEEGETYKDVISITSAGQTTWCSAYDLDFTDKPDLKAYVATGYEKSTGTIWLTRVKQVPANTGFLLMGDAGDYEISVAESASDCYYKNLFKGTISGETIYTTDGDYTNYYLSSGTSGVGFYKVGSSVNLKANRAYLSIPTDIPANGSEGDTETIKVGGALQVPYFTSKNLDFSTMEAQGVKAYTATGYNYKTGTIWLTRVKQVPAQTGVLVMADEAGEYSVPTASVASVYENLFVGSETAQTIYDIETIDGIDYVNYYLSNGDYGVSFYKAKPEGVALGANRCYLQVPYRASAPGARGGSRNITPVWRNMILSDEGDDVIGIPLFTEGETGIQSSMFNDQSSDVYYNLHGQRVNRPSKGLYIKNGKKVIVK